MYNLDKLASQPMMITIKRIYQVFIVLLVLQISSLNAVHASQDKPLRIAVSSNFSPTLKELAPSFTKEHGIEVQIISASTGALFQQIMHGAPFDVFMAADAVRPEKLIEQQLAFADSKNTYALGVLVYWSAKSPPNSLTQLANTSKRIGIANPDIAPYGKAAKQALQHLGIWEKQQNNMIMGININQTFQQIRSQAVDSGIVALSQLKLNRLTGIIIPSDHHQPIAQQLVIIKSSLQQENAKKFSDFIMSNVIQTRIAQLGYLTQDQKSIN